MFSRRQLGGKWWAGGTHVPLNMSIYIQNKRHIDPQIHAEIWSSDLCFGLGQGGACSFRLDSLYLLSLRLSWASQISHMALSMIWFQSIWEKSLLRKRSVGGGEQTEYNMSETSVRVVRRWRKSWCRGWRGGMMKRGCSLDLWRASGKCRDNFKRAPWNIQHTTTAAAAASAVAPNPCTFRCGVFELVVFCSCSQKLLWNASCWNTDGCLFVFAFPKLRLCWGRRFLSIFLFFLKKYGSESDAALL